MSRISARMTVTLMDKLIDRLTGNRLIGLVAAVIALALVLLFFRHPLPPLFDWPSHMARHYLEALALAGRPALEFYAVEYAVMPNLGGDIVVPWLVMLLGPGLASQAFLIFSVGLTLLPTFAVAIGWGFRILHVFF